MRRIPINTDARGNAKTILAGYWKFRFRNLTHNMGGGFRRFLGHRGYRGI